MGASNSNGRSSLLRRAVYTAGALLLGAMLLELVLGGIALLSPTVANTITFASVTHDPRRVPDDVLVERPNPDWPDHDSAGFRNPERLLRAEVVALGDSQTYGTGVRAEEAWPLALATQTGRPVYNMGFPGYGPTHQLVLLEEALDLEPQVVVATLYAGNDLFDAFRLTHHDGAGPELAGPDEAGAAAIEAAERAGTLVDRVMAAYASRRTGLMGFVSRNSMIYGLLRATKKLRKPAPDPDAAPPTWEQLVAKAARRPGRNEAFEGGGFRTVFTPAYRGLALDRDDPCILEGERLCLEAFRRMATRAEAAGARFLVLGIPTKEHVHAHLVGDAGSEVYDQLVADEAALWASVRAALGEAGIEFVDGLGALRNPMIAGAAPYPIDTDGHPNPTGQASLAAAVGRALATEGSR